MPNEFAISKIEDFVTKVRELLGPEKSQEWLNNKQICTGNAAYATPQEILETLELENLDEWIELLTDYLKVEDKIENQNFFNKMQSALELDPQI